MTENPLESLHVIMATDARDWSLGRRDAWMYGVVCGWPRSSLKKLAARHKWEPEEVERLARLHKAYECLRGKFEKESR